MNLTHEELDEVLKNDMAAFTNSVFTCINADFYELHEAVLGYFLDSGYSKVKTGAAKCDYDRDCIRMQVIAEMIEL